MLYLVGIVSYLYVLVLAAVAWRVTHPVTHLATSTCCNCSAPHSRRNLCDGSFKAFCSDACDDAGMEYMEERVPT
jgi:hypothetical protein